MGSTCEIPSVCSALATPTIPKVPTQVEIQMSERQTHQRCDECVSEITTKYINKAITIITDYIQRASKNETLQEIKNCLDKNILLSNDENCDQGMLMAVYIDHGQPYTGEVL